MVEMIKMVNMEKLFFILRILLAIGIVLPVAVVSVIANDVKDQLTYNANLKIFRIQQKLDHFDKNDNRTWQMLYAVNNEFFIRGGPLFVYIGGESTLPIYPIMKGHMYDMAEIYNGYMISTEHRYYGYSRPFNKLTTENMKYLNAQQAIADVVYIIERMKKSIPGLKNSEVVLNGCGYSGSLVTWFKKLYPNLANHYWASNSLPPANANLYEIREILGVSIKLVGGVDCYNRLNRGFAELESMFANNSGSEVKAMLRLCDSFNVTNNLDVSTLFYQISDLFILNVNEIEKSCSKIMNGPSDVIGVTNYILSRLNDTTCNDMTYATYLKSLKEHPYDSDLSMQPLMYQRCNEFGWFPISNSTNQPFGTKYNLDYFITLCADLFGNQFTGQYIEQRLNETNKLFGDLHLNVYPMHHIFDDWTSPATPHKRQSTFIPYIGYCGGMELINSNTPSRLRQFKKSISTIWSLLI